MLCCLQYNLHFCSALAQQCWLFPKDDQALLSFCSSDENIIYLGQSCLVFSIWGPHTLEAMSAEAMHHGGCTSSGTAAPPYNLPWLYVGRQPPLNCTMGPGRWTVPPIVHVGGCVGAPYYCMAWAGGQAALPPTTLAVGSSSPWLLG